MAQNALQQFFTHKEMKFAPVQEDDDELSQFIKNDPVTHDNEWDLHESLDGEQLDAFWSDALNELGPLEAENADED
ncbi:MAG TPA: hypothetical protein VFO38_06280 [Candidatus Saccharimonadales bacterium]|nr:hypothetical protein [Candidatus Saccharimonadales bacterium]